MKLSTKILVGYLALNALMPIMFTLMGLADPASLVGAFGVGINSESIAVGALLPSFTIVVAAWTILATLWVYRGKPEGYTLTLWLAVLCIIAGVLNGIVFARMGRNPMVDAPDAIRGLIMLGLCWWVGRPEAEATRVAATA